MIGEAELTLAETVLSQCRAAGLRVATAESCTGGLIAAALTAIAGSSDVVDRGFVTYSNAAKTTMLGVPADLIAEVGAVSEPVARLMAEGALAASDADLAVAVTGVAGPGGGTAAKPVGLVWFGLARKGLAHKGSAHKGNATQTIHLVLPGGRAEVRRATVAQALTMLLAAARR